MAGKVIKFVSDDVHREVTAIDVGVLELKTAVDNLEIAVEHIHGQIDE